MRSITVRHERAADPKESKPKSLVSSLVKSLTSCFSAADGCDAQRRKYRLTRDELENIFFRGDQYAYPALLCGYACLFYLRRRGCGPWRPSEVILEVKSCTVVHRLSN